MNGVDHSHFPTTLLVSVLLAAMGAMAVADTTRRLRGTTLVGGQLWIGASLLTIAAVEIWLELANGHGGTSLANPLRYIAATLTFCPLMALLGAKRPQDRAWHFIVVSLWVVLALPAFHVVLLRKGQALTIPPALAYFMLGLVTIGFLNRLATRAWLSGFLFACGQTELLPAHSFPFAARAPEFDPQMCTLIGLGLIAASTVQTWWVVVRRPTVTDPLDRMWIEFRDLFGVFWALRLAERVNSAATATNSEVLLRWTGFQTSAGGKITERLSADEIRVLRQGLENLLRRFVSRAWIAERLRETAEQVTTNRTGVDDEIR